MPRPFSLATSSVTVTANFRLLYAFVIMEVGTRRIAHFNVTAHPTAVWTLQQFREAITGEQTQHFLIHDRNSIYSSDLDSTSSTMDLRLGSGTSWQVIDSALG